MKFASLFLVPFIVISHSARASAEGFLRALRQDCSPKGVKADECGAKAKSGHAYGCCRGLTCDTNTDSNTHTMCMPSNSKVVAGDWTKPAPIPPKEVDNPCKDIEELASDVQVLVDGIKYVKGSPICTLPPERRLIDVTFWLYSTAACEYFGGVGAILDAVSGPIADSQLEKCLTLEEIEGNNGIIGTAVRQALKLKPPSVAQISSWLTQGMNGNFIFGNECPENCIDSCNEKIGDSCLISTCDGTQCVGSVEKRCKSNKNIMETTCESFLNYGLSSSSEAIKDLRDAMVERCLLVVDSVEESCRDIFLNGDEGACNDLVNYDQATWDQCIGDCDERQRSEECGSGGSGCGECDAEEYFTECCSGDRLWLWLNCKHIADSEKFCCSKDMTELLPNEC